MADRKISQFEDFIGSGDSKTYFVVASGESTDVAARNYKWDFKTLAEEMKAEMFGGEYPFSGNEDALHFGLFSPEDDRDLKFDIGGDTKMKIVSGQGVYIKDDLRVSGNAYLLENTYVDNIYGNSGYFTLLESDYGVILDLKSVTGCFSDALSIGNTHFNEYDSNCYSHFYRGYINCALNASFSGLFIDAKTRDGAENNVPLFRMDAGIASEGNASATANETFFWANSAGRIHVGSVDPTIDVLNPGVTKFRISEVGGEQFKVDDGSDPKLIVRDGFVGVHHPEPSAELHIKSPNYNPIFIQRQASVAGDYVGVDFKMGHNSNVDANKSYGFIGSLIEDPINNQEDGALVFHTTQNSTSAGSVSTTERVRIDSAGRVGIRETNPQSWLHIGAVDDAVDGTNGIIIENDSGNDLVKIEVGEFADSYIGTSSASYFNIRTNDTDRITISDTGEVAVNSLTPGTTRLGAAPVFQFLVEGGPSYLYDYLVIDGLTTSPILALLGGGSSATNPVAGILTDLNITAIGTSADNTTIPNPLVIDDSGTLSFGSASTNGNVSPLTIKDVTGRTAGKDAEFRNSEGTSHQRLTMADGNNTSGSGIEAALHFETSIDSGANWSEKLRVNTSQFLWNGEQMAKLSDIKDGTLTIQQVDTTSLGTFTANQSGNTTITVPNPANDGTLSIATTAGTVLGSFTANQSTDVTITVPDPPPPGNGTLTIDDGAGTVLGTFTANQGTDSTISVAASVAIATATKAGIVYPGNGLEVASDGALSLVDWNSTTAEPSLYTSDSRLKENKKFLTDSCNKLNRIVGYTFDWSEDAPSQLAGQKDIGVLAQDVQQVIPEAVGQDKDGNLAVAYHKLIPLLIESIKDQGRQIDLLKKQVSLLQNK